MRILVLEGTPREMGQLHGALLAGDIRLFTTEFLHRSRKVFGVPYEVIRHHADLVDATCSSSLLEECAGIADAADADYLDVLALNTFPDTDALFHHRVLNCVNFAAVSSGGEAPTIFHARNCDFPHEDRHWQRGLLVVRKPGGHRQATIALGFAGQAGLITGVNAAGLAASEVTSYAPRYAAAGMPLMFALREALECSTTLASAREFLTAQSYMGAFNVLFSSAHEHAAMAFELSAPGIGLVPMRQLALCISGVCQDRRRARGQLVPCADTVRHLRTQALIDALPTEFTPLDLESILRDEWDLWQQRRGNSYRCICNGHTVHSMIAALAHDELWVSLGPPPAPRQPYHRLSLSTLLDLPPGLHTHPACS